MSNPWVLNRLSQLEAGIRTGMLTPAKVVDLETYICYSIDTAHGTDYMQRPFENLTDAEQAMFKGHTVGTKIKNFKILAIFHLWPLEDVEASDLPMPKVQLAN